jgi:hypothetical protein
VKIELRHVHYMPAVLELGVLYFSEEYGTAAHLCACGCGSKIRTPIGPTEWSIDRGQNGVSLSPSVGNWQRPCRSHYWILDGETVWSGPWTDKQIQVGRQREMTRRATYYSRRRLSKRLHGIFLQLWRKMVG